QRESQPPSRLRRTPPCGGRKIAPLPAAPYSPLRGEKGAGHICPPGSAATLGGPAAARGRRGGGASGSELVAQPGRAGRTPAPRRQEAEPVVATSGLLSPPRLPVDVRAPLGWSGVGLVR